MFRHYLTTAFRFLKRNRLYTLINALGLSISLAISFIILLFVINEFSYNHCHKKRKQVFRVVNYYKEFKNTMLGTPYVLARTLEEVYPQVEKAINVRFLRGFKLMLGNEYFDIRSPLASQSEVFDIFTIPFIGAPINQDPLGQLNSIVISRMLSDQFFPGEDPVGREIEALINNTEQLLVVTGVYEDIPVNSTFRADCFVNGRWTLEHLNRTFGVSDMDVSWTRDFWNTWILLSEDADPEEMDGQFETFGKKYISEDPQVLYSLQNLSDVYLQSADIANTGLTGDIKNIRLFSTVAVLILLIATIELLFEEAYAAEKNLGTILSIAAGFTLLIAAFGLFGLTLFVARSRTHEIGIKKVFGSSGKAIVYSFLGGNFLMVLFAGLLSVPVTLYFLRRWLDNFPYRVDIGWWVFAIAFLLAAGVVLLTVSLHAVRASRTNPVDALRYE
ncbi:MAG: ABC transporter permease [Bacteroidales bacterium]|nr:ABC transporter permease [Bacteroidales bacterium]